MEADVTTRQRPKIERVSDTLYRANLTGGRSADIQVAEITIWDMALPAAKQEQYRAINLQNVPKPKGGENLSVDRDARLTPNQMFALHNRIASVTSWFPIESGERQWKDIFSKFHTLVLYDGKTPVGIAHYTKPEADDKTVELKYIGLQKDMIGKGAGRYFATASLAHMAQQYPNKQIVLGTTSFDTVNGKLALGFHKHMGFELMAGEPLKKHILDTREYYKIPDVVERHRMRFDAAFPRIDAESQPTRDAIKTGKVTAATVQPTP